MSVIKRAVIFAISGLFICGCDYDEFDETGKETPIHGETFAVSGVVRGSVLSGGTLTATGKDGQGSFSTTTDETGAWQIENVPVGRYHVTVTGGVWIDADGAETENAGTLVGAFQVTGGVVSNLIIGMRSTLFVCGIMYPEVSVLEAFSPKLKNGDFEKP
ncbi:MAG: carboxypeptidase regulatory-like domain-containing protein, partial [bacterium]|nr:carboxypeptidase regulatory-like domain-containing protein [bacterium]